MHADHQSSLSAPASSPPAALRIARPELECRLTRAPIAVLVGPPGSGKSELLRSLYDDPATISFRVGNARATFARFVHGLAQAVVPLAPGAHASFPRAWERALQSRSPGATLAHWLCEHLGGITAPLVIDDLHDAAADPSIAAFITKLAELRSEAPLVIALRSTGALPIPLWMATRRMARPIDADDLRFRPAETALLAERLGLSCTAREVAAILAPTGGSPIAVRYALAALCENPHAFESTPPPAAFEDIAGQIFARRTGRQRAFLFSAALFGRMEDPLLALSGWDDAPAIRASMAADAAFMWEADERSGLRFHDRFRDVLERRFAACDPDFRSTIAHRTVASLTRAGRFAGALNVATSQRLSGAMRTLLDENGFELLESGEIDAISDALDALDSSDDALGAKVLALRGYLDSRRGRLDTGEAWFRLGLEKAPDETARVAIAMYYARELATRRREDACDVLAPFAESPTLGRNVLLDVRSSYAQALTAANRLEEARAQTDDVLALLEPDSPPALRARVFARAAYVALESGDLRQARERARIAAPLAIAQSLYDVAASTYSVLYNIAYEIDDDAPAALEYLRGVRDLGIKSGTLRLDLYALLGMYGLAAERGDDAAIAGLGHELAALDKHDAGAEIMEALLPARALQAAWSGHFDDAQRLLRATADHQATPERRALCWAQIALYRVAAGDSDGAAEAAAGAQAALAEVDVHTVLYEWALLILGLCAWERGDAAAAWRWTTAADRATLGGAPRLRALRAALAALVDPQGNGEAFAAGVAAALECLRAASFGGMARVIEALPDRRKSARGCGTIGGILARQELPARFAAALERRDPGALRPWLDSLSAARLREIAPTESFDRWVASSPLAGAHAPSALTTLRRRLEAYQPSAPAIMTLVDDIDTTIGTLFGHLDAAAPLMAEHSRAVSAWCSRIARTLGLTETEIEFVTRGGLIHDIGKVRTPAAILNAPRSLSAGEWAIMQSHAAEGGRLIADAAVLKPFIPIVRGHHERLDGRGYPDGLSLTAIPFAARIVSVADSFNAMIGRRPYRLPLAPNEALGELLRNRRTQFDPEVVEALCRIVGARGGELPVPMPAGQKSTNTLA